MISIYDINQSAFVEQQGIRAELQKIGSRVIFCFPNDAKTQQAMKLYNENPSIPILDFVSHLRKLRSLMLSERG